MRRYAETTSVSSEKSRAEIETVLRRHGAEQFISGWSPGCAVIGFVCHGKQVKFTLPLPDRNSKQFTNQPVRGYRRSEAKIEEVYEQAIRQRWRALALAIKAKLEAVECGITTFEDEFLAHFVLPDGMTVGQHAIPRLEEAILNGIMPKLLPMLEQ